VEQADDELVRLVFQACAELSRRTGRSVSPDGHLVGSLGEIHAASQLGLTLQPASNAGYDAIDAQGRKVEIKTTTRASISLSAAGTHAERLIVVQLEPLTGTARIAYDGAAAHAWALAGKPGRNGQRTLAITTLLKRSAGPDAGEQLPAPAGARRTKRPRSHAVTRGPGSGGGQSR
jgi:hypothetical protein